MPAIEELKQQHTIAHDRATEAQAALLDALLHVGDDVAARVVELDRANAKLGIAAQAVVNAGGAVHEHQRVPYLAAPVSPVLEGLLHDVRAYPVRIAGGAVHEHQLATGDSEANAKAYTTETDARKHAELRASPPAVQAVPRAVAP